MGVLEFHGPVSNGALEILREYLTNLRRRVRVILLLEEVKPAVNLIEELLTHPVRVKGFRPLTREEVCAT